MHNAHSETSQPSLTEVRLYGHLRARFGKSHYLDVASANEAVRALSVVLPGFKSHLITHSTPGYRVWLGHDVVQKNDELAYPGGKLIRIVPATGGGGGFGKIIIGAALIAASIYFPGVGAIAGTSFSLSSLAGSFGASLVLGGISEMLTSNPSAVAPVEKANNQPSYAFAGAVNTTAQGNAIPILYGRARIGSQVISTGLTANQIVAGVTPPAVETSGDVYAGPPEGGGGGTE